VDSTSQKRLQNSGTSWKETPVLVAHNGLHFDFAVLLAECERHGIEMPLDWAWVDSLDVARRMLPNADCKKLRCLAKDLGVLQPQFGGSAGRTGARKPHRALSDACLLRDVCVALAETVLEHEPALAERYGGGDLSVALCSFARQTIPHQSGETVAVPALGSHVNSLQTSKSKSGPCLGYCLALFGKFSSSYCLTLHGHAVNTVIRTVRQTQHESGSSPVLQTPEIQKQDVARSWSSSKRATLMDSQLAGF